MRALSCPECAVTMQAFYAEARDAGPVVELDRCAKCTRIWFDVKELERAVGKSFLPRLKGARAAHACPACRTMLDTSLIRGDVPIEECGSCGGALLDKGDFEMISGAPLREVKPKPPPGKPSQGKVVEFTCERCRKRTPVSQAGNVNGAMVCKSCELQPWPNQPGWYRRTGDSLGDEIDRALTRLFDDLFR